VALNVHLFQHHLLKRLLLPLNGLFFVKYICKGPFLSSMISGFSQGYHISVMVAIREVSKLGSVSYVAVFQH
jgi:hypothetical protein